MKTRQSRFQQLVPQRIQALIARMDQGIWFDDVAVTAEVAPPGTPKVTDSTVFEPVTTPFHLGTPHGDWQHRWLRLHLPRDGETRYLWWKCDGEATVYHKGEPWAGLDVAHRWCRLPSEAAGVLVDVALYQTAIWTEGGELPEDHVYEFRGASIRRRNEVLWELYWDISVLHDVARQLLVREGIAITEREGYNAPHAEVSPQTRFIWNRLEGAADCYDRGDLGGMKRILTETYQALRSSEYHGTAVFFGHAHIDLVWLWPLRETLHKGVHTFSTVLRLMEEDPEFVFQHSSPFLLRWIEGEQPNLWRRIARRIDEGRWEVSGALELESDLWLTSGEGLVRSFRWGQQYFREKTGHPAALVWLPDVFGYPDCLPQLMRQSGARWFFTQKLSWSSVTRFPMTAFTWRGSDGSEVLGYMSPVGYNGAATVGETETASRRNYQSGLGVPTLIPVGFGDGGGGPTPEMLEQARRQRSLSPLPHSEWQTPSAAFRRIESMGEALPVYSGELYLEYHRGTYTSQKRFKTLVRRVERAILLLEAWQAIRRKAGLDYRWWKPLLLSQFHDAIPGSSIGIVYTELTRDLERLRSDIESQLERDISPTGRPRRPAVFYPHPFSATITLEAADTPAVREAIEAEAIPYQKTDGLRLLFRSSVPGFGFHPPARPRGVAEDEPATVEVSDSGLRIANGWIAAFVDRSGVLTVHSMATGREILREGALRAYRDVPANFDAWDIDQHVERLAMAVSCSEPRVRETGPLRVTVECDVQIGKSDFRLQHQLVAGETMVRMRVFNGWGEAHRLLRWECRGSGHHTAMRLGGPFGSTRRDVRPGPDPRDAAWEVPGHLWAALVTDSETEGIAIATEASYGFRGTPERIAVSLLRSPEYPDPEADRGGLEVAWAAGPFIGATVPAARDVPPTARMPEILYGAARIIDVPDDADPPPVEFVETGSLAESGIEATPEGDGFLVRLHETVGAHGRVVFVVAEDTWDVALVDLLIDELTEQVAKEGCRYTVEYRPYQILTLAFRER